MGPSRSDALFTSHIGGTENSGLSPADNHQGDVV